MKSPFSKNKNSDGTYKMKLLSEQKEYFDLFDNIVDDVSVKQYTERGGKISDIGEEYIKKSSLNNVKVTEKFKQIKEKDPNSEIMRDNDGNIFISKKGRLPREQPYQRMLVTYDGRVSMCCYGLG